MASFMDPLGIFDFNGTGDSPQDNFSWEAGSTNPYANDGHSIGTLAQDLTDQFRANKAYADQRLKEMAPGFLHQMSGGQKYRPIEAAPAPQWGYQAGQGVTWNTPQHRAPGDTSPGGNQDWSVTANRNGSSGFGFSGNRI